MLPPTVKQYLPAFILGAVFGMYVLAPRMKSDWYGNQERTNSQDGTQGIQAKETHVAHPEKEKDQSKISIHMDPLPYQGRQVCQER